MKRFELMFITFIIILVTSCGTINNRYHYYKDTKEADAGVVALLAYDNSITIKEVNGEEVKWNRTGGDKVIYLPEGEYSFLLKYGASTARGWSYTDFVPFGPVILEGGKHYTLSVGTFDNLAKFFVRESSKPVNDKSKVSFFP